MLCEKILVSMAHCKKFPIFTFAFTGLYLVVTLLLLWIGYCRSQHRSHLGHEFLVITLLDNISIFHHENQIRITNSGQAIDDKEVRPSISLSMAFESTLLYGDRQMKLVPPYPATSVSTLFFAATSSLAWAQFKNFQDGFISIFLDYFLQIRYWSEYFHKRLCFFVNVAHLIIQFLVAIVITFTPFTKIFPSNRIVNVGLILTRVDLPEPVPIDENMVCPFYIQILFSSEPTKVSIKN